MFFFSATMPNEALELTRNILKNPLKILIKQEELTLNGIRQFYINCEREDYKLNTLLDLYETLNITQAVIFCNTKDRVKWLTNEFLKRNFTVSSIHSDYHPMLRRENLETFKSGNSRILISTDVTARGIDVHGVSIVINYDIPKNKMEVYIHRIGRSGRFGRKGVAVNLISEQEKYVLGLIERHYSTKIDPMPDNISNYL